jgi:hypothetical protein
MLCGVAYALEPRLYLDDGGGAAESVFEEEIRPEWFEGIRSTAIIGGVLVMGPNERWQIVPGSAHRALGGSYPGFLA